MIKKIFLLIRTLNEQLKPENNMDILCLGILVADIIGQRVKRWPEKGKLEFNRPG